MKFTSITYSSLLGLLPCLVQGKRTLIEDYSGPQFFSKMDFFSKPNPTSGHVKYVDMSTANSSGLAGLFKTMHAEQAVYLGTDHENKTPEGRPSIRVSSQRTYDSGLFVADISHMPGGVCGTWPAYWLLGTATPWPQAGEVDIIEGINLNTDNTMALHVAGDFTVNDDVNAMSAHLESSNADVNAADQPHNKGAVAMAPKNLNSYGTDFNANMGGVYATEVNPSAKYISIWFFSRGAIPADVTSDDPQPSTWGKPLAKFAGNDLDFAAKFKNLQIIINLTFCGEWAGKPHRWAASECSKLADTCEAYVSDNPEAFKDMFWAINSLKVFDVEDNSSSEPSLTVGPPLLASTTAVASIQTSPPTLNDNSSSSEVNPYAVPSSAPAGSSIPRIPYPNNAAAGPPHPHRPNRTSNPQGVPYLNPTPSLAARSVGQTHVLPPFSAPNTPPSPAPSEPADTPRFPIPSGVRPYGAVHPSGTGAARPSGKHGPVVFPTNFFYNPTLLTPSGFWTSTVPTAAAAVAGSAAMGGR